MKNNIYDLIPKLLSTLKIAQISACLSVCLDFEMWLTFPTLHKKIGILNIYKSKLLGGVWVKFFFSFLESRDRKMT